MIRSINGFVSLQEYKRLMSKKEYTFTEVEKLVFKNNLTPLRYQRNQSSISQKQQYKLFKSKVAIIGCGGLGGFTAEFLARIGIGKMILIDDDVYCEHNINRQNFSTPKAIGKSKVKFVKKRLKEINPALNIEANKNFLCKKNIKNLLKNCDVVIDCVDNIKTKKLLAKFCQKNSINFVYGAIAGWSVQASFSTNLDTLYKDNSKGAESFCGNLVLSASFCASIQATFCINLLLNKNFSNSDILFADLKNLEFFNIPL